MIRPNETTFTATNTGTTPVQLLAWVLLAGAGPAAQVPWNWIGHHGDVQSGLSVPAGPATVQVRRVTLTPGAAVAAPSGALQFAVALPDNAAGTPVLGSLGTQSIRLALDGTMRNIGQQPAIIYVLTFVPTGPGIEPSTAAPARE